MFVTSENVIYTREYFLYVFHVCGGSVSCGRKKMGITINNKQFKTDVANIMKTLLNISSFNSLIKNLIGFQIVIVITFNYNWETITFIL